MGLPAGPKNVTYIHTKSEPAIRDYLTRFIIHVDVVHCLCCYCQSGFHRERRKHTGRLLHEAIRRLHLPRLLQPSPDKIITHDCTNIQHTQSYTQMSLTRVDTFEIQQIILWVNLVELQVQFDNHSRIGMDVTTHGVE